MNQPDRLQAPGLNTPGRTPVTKAETFTLDNGLRLYAVNAGVQEVIRMELIVPSGVGELEGYLPALAAHDLIDSGTKRKNAMQVAEGFDFFGAHLESDINADWKTLTLFSLSRLLPDTLPLLQELLQDAVYPDKEMETWRTRQIQQLRVQQGKVSWLARTAFSSEIFGPGHVYGYTAQEAHLKSLSTETIRKSYQQGYLHSGAMVILAGKFGPGTIESVNRTIGSMPLLKKEVPVPPALEPHSQRNGLKKIRIEKSDAVQSCIRIGKRLFPKNHPDFIELTVASTILGGYFGSRLMANIREDKGYTYGIGSAMVPHLHGGTFFISTEVGSDVCEAALSEIYDELERLAALPVPEDELLLVKNYLIGAFQRSIDGPFGLADRFKGIKLHGLDYQYLDKYQEVLHTIQPETIQALTKKWLSPDSMTEVVAG